MSLPFFCQPEYIKSYILYDHKPYHPKLYFIGHMHINCHSFKAFISINIFFLARILLFLFVFANISSNTCIHIHIWPVLVNPNIFIFIFVYKMKSKYIYICIHQKISTPKYLYWYFLNLFDPNISVFIFGPENCIHHTYHGQIHPYFSNHFHLQFETAVISIFGPETAVLTILWWDEGLGTKNSDNFN